jgi:MFS transporter, PPP family, 3-phenylpropionic acid transporter
LNTARYGAQRRWPLFSAHLTVGQLICRTDVTPIIWMNLSFLVVATASTALLPPVVVRSSPLTGGYSVIGELGELLRIPRFRMMILGP